MISCNFNVGDGRLTNIGCVDDWIKELVSWFARVNDDVAIQQPHVLRPGKSRSALVCRCQSSGFEIPERPPLAASFSNAATRLSAIASAAAVPFASKTLTST